MSNVVALLPRPGQDASENLTELVAFYKRNSPFKSKRSWHWNNVYWDVKGICKTQSRKAAYELFLYFNRDNQKGANVKTSRTEMQLFHHAELSDVLKCHVTALQIESKKDVGTLQIWINAYRYLDNVLSKSGKQISDMSAHDFRLAELDAQKRLASSTFYRIGGKFEGICKFINRKGLTRHKITFRKVAKRGDTHTNCDSRVDKSSVDERAKKLPSKYSLIAVATLSNADLKDDDALFQSMVEIMFATGLRFDEVVSLDKHCLYEKEIEERNVLTGKQHVFTVHELRYKAKKGGGYRSKIIAGEMLPILRKGLDTALTKLAPVRTLIEKIKSGTADFFPKLGEAESVFITDVWKDLGWSSRSNFGTYLKKRKIPTIKIRNKVTNIQSLAFSPSTLKKENLSQAQQSLKNLWNEVKTFTVASCLENMLFVTQFQRHHSDKRAEDWSFTLVTHTQFSDYLSGRPELGVKSIFERYNLMFEDQPVRLTSHQFRHFLSTMLELSDTVSDIEVARYFGRKYIGDNETYDHTNKAKKVMDHAEEIIGSTAISSEQEKEVAILFTLVDREEALDTIDDLTTTLTTSIGLCKHDYNDSPCGKHYACLRGCAEYYRTKGNKTEIDEVSRIRGQQKQHVAEAKQSVAEEFHNANNWLISHEELLDGCEIALDIEHDDNIVDGERVQVFPDGKTKCEAI
jgi:hypothetical protein